MTTLVINADESYCAACGHGADPKEVRHVTVLGLDGGDPQAIGCDALFTETATDTFVYPKFAAAVAELRPDLPFIGRNGMGGRA